MTPLNYPSSILYAKTLNFTSIFRYLNIFLNLPEKEECFFKIALPYTAN